MSRPRVGRPYYIKWVWKDWLAKTRHMTHKAKGAYVDLMAWAATNSPDCSSVPLDDSVLARAVGMTLRAWLSVRQEVLAQFELTDAVGVHPRLREEAESFAQLCEKQRQRRTAGQPPDDRRSTGMPPSALARDLDLEESESSPRDNVVFQTEQQEATAREDDAQRTAALVDDLVTSLQDQNSRAFYVRVANRLPELDVRVALAEALEAGRNGSANRPAAVFAAHAKRLMAGRSP